METDHCLNSVWANDITLAKNYVNIINLKLCRHKQHEPIARTSPKALEKARQMRDLEAYSLFISL